jgi:hypothetical protein
VGPNPSFKIFFLIFLLFTGDLSKTKLRPTNGGRSFGDRTHDTGGQEGGVSRRWTIVPGDEEFKAH